MKISQELSISFWLRKYDKSPGPFPAITVRITINGEKDGFSIGYKVDPKKFDHKAAAVTGKSQEAIEINKHILYVRSELIRHYNLLKAQGSTVTPAMLKNAYLGIGQEKKTLLQVVDFHNARYKEKVDKEKRAGSTLKKWQWETEKIERNTGASHDSLIALEHSIGFVFPEDFKALYSHVNGFIDYEWRVNMFSVWSLERILNEYDNCNDENFIGFADFLINCHHIGFHKTQAGIFKSYSADEYIWISDSFLHAIQLINTNADLIY